MRDGGLIVYNVYARVHAGEHLLLHWLYIEELLKPK